jgi:hypothetical protein
VVTRADIGAYLAEVGSSRDVDATVKHLQRLGWLVPVHIRGAWAYLPPGEEQLTDRYIDLRAWRARDPEAVFALAGEAAAWHLGYLDREFSGPPPIWGLSALDLWTDDIEMEVSTGALDIALDKLTAPFNGLGDGTRLGWPGAGQQADLVSDIANQVRQARNLRAGRLGSEDG